MPDPKRPCTTCGHAWNMHTAAGCWTEYCDCRYYSVSEPGLSSLPKPLTEQKLEAENEKLAKLLAQTMHFTYGELYLTIKAALAERKAP